MTLFLVFAAPELAVCALVALAYTVTLPVRKRTL